MWQLLFRFFAECVCQARAFLVTFCRLNETSLDLCFQYSNVRVLKSRLSKQSFRWHQPDLHNSQFYNSHTELLSRVFRMSMANERLHKLRSNWLMENLMTQMLEKKSLFVTNKSFPWNYCVTTCRFAYLHTVTAWQVMVSTEMPTWKFCFLERT